MSKNIFQTLKKNPMEMFYFLKIFALEFMYCIRVLHDLILVNYTQLQKRRKIQYINKLYIYTAYKIWPRAIKINICLINY